jgi:hypothetical protein
MSEITHIKQELEEIQRIFKRYEEAIQLLIDAYNHLDFVDSNAPVLEKIEKFLRDE